MQIDAKVVKINGVDYEARAKELTIYREILVALHTADEVGYKRGMEAAIEVANKWVNSKSCNGDGTTCKCIRIAASISNEIARKAKEGLK